jgi:hypothetical protein
MGKIIEEHSIFFVKLSKSSEIVWKIFCVEVVMCVGEVGHCVVFEGNELIRVYDQWSCCVWG